MTSVTVAGNSASGDGGGIAVGGELTLTDSTVDDNHAAGAGGGLISYAALTVFNSTISNNSTGFDGGGIQANGSGAARLFHTTIAGNLADHAGLGGYVGGGISIGAMAPVQLWNTLLADRRQHLVRASAQGSLRPG